MKKIVMVIVAVALIAAGVFGTLAVQRTFEPSISLSSTSIQEQLSDCSELARPSWTTAASCATRTATSTSSRRRPSPWSTMPRCAQAWIWRRPASRSAATPSR
ncbi:MAG: hypothetical protein ACLSVD_16315 [Eggerthellaceae bacterium]